MENKKNENRYDQIINVVAEHLQQEGFRHIQANISGYDQPERVKWEPGDKGVLPDMTAEAKEKTFVFEVENRVQNVNESLIDRWRLLSAHARRNGGDLYLVVSEDNVQDIRRSLANEKVSARILPIAGV